jgi:hypothetical protein
LPPGRRKPPCGIPIDLTMNVYTDPKLSDVAGAMETLPALPLSAGSQTEAAVLSATGTDDSTLSPLVPPLVPTTGKPWVLQSIIDKVASDAKKIGNAGSVAVSAYPVKRKNPPTTAVNGSSKSGRLDLNQRPLGPEPSALARLSYAPLCPKSFLCKAFLLRRPCCLRLTCTPHSWVFSGRF